MNTTTIYIVTTGWDYEGFNGQWVFTDEASARAHYETLASRMRAAEEDISCAPPADFVSLRGPFALGQDMLSTNDRIAYCHPRREAEEAARQTAHQAKLAKDRAARRAKKAAEVTEYTDCYTAMRMRDGG